MSRPTHVQRFWSKVDRSAGPDACWLWTGTVDRSGYGSFSAEGFGRAHRYSFWLATRIQPGPLHVMHRCDNPPCVNPRHLRLGSNADNTADRQVKRRNQRGRRVNTNKLTEMDVIAIRGFRSLGVTEPRLAKAFGIGRTHVWSITSCNSWSWLPNYRAIPVEELAS